MAKNTGDLKDLSSWANFSLAKCSMYKKQRLMAPNSAASKFMSVVTDDLFMEILVRLPHVQSVMQCASVCKRWYSLIITPKFKLDFIQYHLRKQSLDSSYNTLILFNYSEYNCGPYFQLCSDQLKHYDLSFMRNCGDLTIRAASDDLLLVCSDARHYFIFNSLTKQWFSLPEVPRRHYFNTHIDRIFAEEACGSFGFAIARNPVCADEDRYGYKVVIIHFCQFDHDPNENDSYIYGFDVAMFDLETGIWTLKRRFIPYPLNQVADDEFNESFEDIGFEIAVDSNGVLHWLDGQEKLGALFVFDPFSMKSSFVHFPCRQFNHLYPYNSRDRVRLGVVRGRVRLSLMQEDSTLKVWELISESNTWVLVYDFDFNKNSIGKGDMFFVLAFDPNDANVLVLVRNKHIYRYEIEQGKYSKVCEFSYDGESVDQNKQSVAMYLKVLTPMLPFWPTWTLPRSST